MVIEIIDTLGDYVKQKIDTLGNYGKPHYVLIIKEALRQFPDKTARPEALYKKVSSIASDYKVKFSRKAFYFHLNNGRHKEIKKRSLGWTKVEYQLKEPQYQEELEKHQLHLPKMPSDKEYQKMNEHERYHILASMIDQFYLEFMRHAFWYDIEQSLGIKCKNGHRHKKMEQSFRKGFRKVLLMSAQFDPILTERYMITMMHRYHYIQHR